MGPLNPTWVVFAEILVLQLPVDLSILAVVLQLRRRTRAMWPIVTALDTCSDEEIGLVGRWMTRQVRDPKNGIIAVQRRFEEHERGERKWVGG